MEVTNCEWFMWHLRMREKPLSSSWLLYTTQDGMIVFKMVWKWDSVRWAMYILYIWLPCYRLCRLGGPNTSNSICHSWLVAIPHKPCHCTPAGRERPWLWIKPRNDVSMVAPNTKVMVKERCSKETIWDVRYGENMQCNIRAVYFCCLVWKLY